MVVCRECRDGKLKIQMLIGQRNVNLCSSIATDGLQRCSFRSVRCQLLWASARLGVQLVGAEHLHSFSLKPALLATVPLKAIEILEFFLQKWRSEYVRLSRFFLCVYDADYFVIWMEPISLPPRTLIGKPFSTV